MGLQDYLAIATFGLALMGIVYALGKQANNLDYMKNTLVDLTAKLPKYGAFLIRLERRVSALERERFEDQSFQDVEVDLEI
jgi:hypothetical protein